MYWLKHARWIEWPHSMKMTVFCDANMFSPQMGQSASVARSMHLWSLV